MNTQKQQSGVTSTLTQQKKIYVTHTHYSPLVHEAPNLFKYTELNIAFRASNNSYNHLSILVFPSRDLVNYQIQHNLKY